MNLETGMKNSEFPRYGRYKDSGVEWLGEVPEHWDVQSLRSVAGLYVEKNQPDLPVLSVYREFGVILKDSRDDNHNATSLDTSNYKVVRPGDLAVNKMKAWQGSLGVSEHHGIVSPAYITCRLNQEKVNGRYIHYLLRSKTLIGALDSISYGVRVGQWDMRFEDFKKVGITIPSKPEQDRIVTFLDRKTAEIDALIAKKQRQIELLDEQKAILINRAVTRGLNPNAKLKPSGIEWIGDIPEHWEVLKAKYRATYFTSGSRGWGEYYSDEGELFLQSGDLTNDCTISLEKAKRVKLPRHTDGRRTRLQTHDTVVCITGANTGRVANVGDISETIYVNQHVCLVRPSPRINHRFLSLALSGRSARTHFSLCQYGLKEGLNLDDVENCPFPVPPIGEQNAIVEHVDLLSGFSESSVAGVSEQIQSLKTLRSTLIAHAVTGRIKV